MSYTKHNYKKGDELLAYEPGDQEEANTEALLLEMAADHEHRLCLLELGVEI